MYPKIEIRESNEAMDKAIKGKAYLFALDCVDTTGITRTLGGVEKYLHDINYDPTYQELKIDLDKGLLYVVNKEEFTPQLTVDDVDKINEMINCLSNIKSTGFVSKKAFNNYIRCHTNLFNIFQKKEIL